MDHTFASGIEVSKTIVELEEGATEADQQKFMEDMQKGTRSQLNLLNLFLNGFDELVESTEKAQARFTVRGGKLVLTLPTNWDFTVEITVKE